MVPRTQLPEFRVHPAAQTWCTVIWWCLSFLLWPHKMSTSYGRGTLYWLIQVTSEVQHLIDPDIPLTDTECIPPQLSCAPARWRFVAATSYTTICLNTKSPQWFGRSHYSFTKSCLWKVLLALFPFSGIKHPFSSESAIHWVKAVKAPFHTEQSVKDWERSVRWWWWWSPGQFHRESLRGFGRVCHCLLE